MNRELSKRMSVLVVASVVALGLGACSAEIKDEPGESVGEPNTVSTPQGSTPAGSSSPQTPTDETETEEATIGEPGCSPGEDVEVDEPAATMKLAGDCGTVTISAEGATVTVESAAELVVTGDSNTVTATHLGTMSVSGQMNTITWTDGASDGEDTGSLNTLVAP
jgi:hypothetical protein